MKSISIKTGLLACSLSLFFAVSGGMAQNAGLNDSSPAGFEFDLSDRELFPAEFFPDLSNITEGELLLAGLASLYPNRILTELPEAELPEAAAPQVRELEPNGVYVRVVQLGEALPVIKEHLASPLLLLDLRFLATDLDSALALGSLLTRREELELARAGDYPVAPEYLAGDAITIKGENLRRPNQTVFTLSNHETRGPLEAVLAQLQREGAIISVGAPSPGETAAFQPFPGSDAFYIISGEIRPAGGASLADSGFVPQVEVTVDPEADEVAYRSLREGVSLDDLVQARQNRPRPGELARDEESPLTSPLPDEVEEEEEPSPPRDIILQRALNIVKALQALGKIAG